MRNIIPKIIFRKWRGGGPGSNGRFEMNSPSPNRINPSPLPALYTAQRWISAPFPASSPGYACGRCWPQKRLRFRETHPRTASHAPVPRRQTSQVRSPAQRTTACSPPLQCSAAQTNPGSVRAPTQLLSLGFNHSSVSRDATSTPQAAVIAR